MRDFILELHCNLQIINYSELPDNLKVIIFNFVYTSKHSTTMFNNS